MAKKTGKEENAKMSEKYVWWYCRTCRKVYRDFKVAEKCKYCGSTDIFENGHTKGL